MPAMLLKKGNDEYGKPFVICELSELTGQLTMWRYTDDNGNPVVDKRGNPMPTPIVVHLSEELIAKHADKLESIPKSIGTA